MKLKLNSEINSPVVRDIVSCAADAEDCLESIRMYTDSIDELDRCIDNMSFAINSLSKSDNPDTVAKIIGLQESCEGLICDVGEKITIKAAEEGITDSIKKAWRAFIDFCKKFWQKIKDFLFGTVPDRIQNGMDRVKEILKKM